MCSAFCCSLPTFRDCSCLVGLYLLCIEISTILGSALLRAAHRHLLLFCCAKRNHMTMLLWYFFFSQKHILLFSVGFLYPIIMSKAFIWCYPDFQSCWTQSFFSLRLTRMICFRCLQKYGQIGTVEWCCCTRMSFLLRFCFLQFISGSCWLLSAVLEEDLSSDQSLNCILL